MSLKIIDVAIGTAYLFLLVTFIASAVHEVLARVFNWRAQNLAAAIEGMLGNSELLSAATVLGSPLIATLGRDVRFLSRLAFLERAGWRFAQGRIPPSYVPPSAFSGAVLEALLTQAVTADTPLALSPDTAISAIRSMVATTRSETDPLASLLRTTLATQGQGIQALRLAIEKWFNDTMDRASGWYKRKTQATLFVIGLLVASVGNVDTIAVVKWLWLGDSARQAGLAVAATLVARNLPPSTGTSAVASARAVSDALRDIVHADTKIAAEGYPVGWKGLPRGLSDFASQLTGWLMTSIAISMGSTFWFDTLQSLLKLRASGPKPSK